VTPAAGIALTRAQYIELMRRLESVEKISKSYSDISRCYDRLLKAYQEWNEQLATLQRNLTDMGPQVSKIESLMKQISDVELLVSDGTGEFKMSEANRAILEQAGFELTHPKDS